MSNILKAKAPEKDQPWQQFLPGNLVYLFIYLHNHVPAVWNVGLHYQGR